MPTYDFEVPRSRSSTTNPVCEAVADPQQTCINDLFFHLLIGRITGIDGSSYELNTIFNSEVNAVDLDIGNGFLSALEDVGVGPNLQRYLNWINRLDSEATLSDISDLQTDVSRLKSLRIVFSDTTITTSDRTLIVKANSDINLPTAASAEDLDFVIKNAGEYQVTLTPSGSETIDDTEGTLVFDSYESFTVVSDGTEWWLI